MNRQHKAKASVIEIVDDEFGYRCRCGVHFPFGDGFDVLARGCVLCRNCDCGIYIEIVRDGSYFNIVKEQHGHHFDTDMRPVVVPT